MEHNTMFEHMRGSDDLISMISHACSLCMDTLTIAGIGATLALLAATSNISPLVSNKQH